MKKQSKFIWLFGLFLMVLIGLPRSVDASETTDAFIRQIAPDGENITIKSVIPKDDVEADYLMNSVLAKYISDMEGYEYYGWCEGEGYTTCIVDFQSDDYKTEWDSELGKEVVLSGEKESYTLNATYDVPSAANIAMMDNFVSKLADSSDIYEIGDLSLINYYLTGSNSELWNNGAPSRALKFVKELHTITEGSDVNFFMEARMGTEDEVLMYEDARGPMSIYYGDYAFTYLDRGIYLKRVIYIPEDTADNKDAYVAAAQERINDYLGEDNGVVVSYGGLLSSLEDGAEDEELSPLSDGNYYNISVLGRTYKFYIIEDDDNLEVPTYSGKNIGTDISITSDSGKLPLDTMINANKITSGTEYERILSILNLEDNVTYDVKLFSDAKNEYITKLDDGTFKVRIPVPEGFESKNLAVYFVGSDGEPEVFDATFTADKKYIEFATDHFSVYTLGYKGEVSEEDEVVNFKFNANGGKFDDDTTIKIYDIISTSDEDIAIPTREGYLFKGWYTKKDGGHILDYYYGITEELEDGTVVYAQWYKKEHLVINMMNIENADNIAGIEEGIFAIVADKVFDMEEKDGIVYVKNKDGKLLFIVDDEYNYIVAEGLTEEDNIEYTLIDEDKEGFTDDVVEILPEKVTLVFAQSNENEGENVPNTLDTLSSSLVIALVSLVGLVGTTLYLKRKERA